MKNNHYQEEVVWIVGASSGIGYALAQALSARGAILALSARREEALIQLSETLASKECALLPLDVTDPQALEQAAQSIISRWGRIDRIVFLAALYQPATCDQLEYEQVASLIATNLTSAFTLSRIALDIFKAQPTQGQLALCGSVAGYLGLPAGQPYSATKAGIINLAETLYAEQKNRVDIKLISPGFVHTPLTAHNTFDMPMIISAEEAAQAIANGLLSHKFEIHFPRKFTFWLKILRLLPYSLSLALTSKLRK